MIVQRILKRVIDRFPFDGSEFSVLLRKCLDAVAGEEKELPLIMNKVMQGR